MHALKKQNISTPLCSPMVLPLPSYSQVRVLAESGRPTASAIASASASSDASSTSPQDDTLQVQGDDVPAPSKGEPSGVVGDGNDGGVGAATPAEADADADAEAKAGAGAGASSLSANRASKGEWGEGAEGSAVGGSGGGVAVAGRDVVVGGGVDGAEAMDEGSRVLAEGRYECGVLVALDPTRPTGLKLTVVHGGAGGEGGGGSDGGKTVLMLGAVDGCVRVLYSKCIHGYYFDVQQQV